MQNLFFSIITPVFRHMILQKSLYYADLLLKKHFLSLLTLQTFELLYIFLET